MELGLSLGDHTTSSNPSDGFITTTTTTTTTTTVGVDKSLGFCMALGMNPLDGISHRQTAIPHDHDEDDDGNQEHDDQQILKENGGIKDVVFSSQRILMNPPVQLDLLPSVPVPRHTSFPWSSDNGSSDGGSSGNAAVGRGLDVMRVAVTEEATSSFRLEFGRTGNESHKRGFGIGNDVGVVVERASSRASDEDDHNGMSRKKLRLSKEQSAYLEESFKEHNTLNPKQKLALAEQLHLRLRQVEVWFQNRRARYKLVYIVETTCFGPVSRIPMAIVSMDKSEIKWHILDVASMEIGPKILSKAEQGIKELSGRGGSGRWIQNR